MHSRIFASPAKMGDSESMHDCAAASTHAIAQNATHGQEERPQRDLSRDLHLHLERALATMQSQFNTTASESRFSATVGTRFRASW